MVVVGDLGSDQDQALEEFRDSWSAGET